MANWSTDINVRLVSSNPIVKIINILVSIIEFLLGIRRSGILSEEDNHIVIDTKTKTFWFFLKSEDVLKIAKNRVAGVKVSTQKSWFIFRSSVVSIYAAGVSDQVEYEVKCSYAEAKEKAESWLQ